MPYRYIDNQESLEDACQKIAPSAWAAVDTEADSFHHYREKLCLIQISLEQEDFVIDPLAPIDLGPLVAVLHSKELIMHGADFDIRMLNRSCGLKPTQVFDTVIAAQLLGYEKQGLADLAERHCGVILPKANQKADWAQRPLDESMRTYAANDTHYLKAIRDKISEELTALERLDWHAEWCERLIQSATTARGSKFEAGLEWQVKGSKNLSAQALTVLKQLWMWREEEAGRRDVPSFKVIHSEILVKMAAWCVEERGRDVALLPKAPRNIKKQYRDLLNRVIQDAVGMAPTPYVPSKSSKKSVRLGAAGNQKVLLLKEARDKVGKELGLLPSLLVTNASLEAIVASRPATAEQLTKAGRLMLWQGELLADSFLRILHSNN